MHQKTRIITWIMLTYGVSFAGVSEIMGSIQTTFSKGASPQVVLGVALTALVLITLLVFNEIRKSDQRERARAKVSWESFYALATERGLLSTDVKILEGIISEARLVHADSILESAQVFENSLDSYYQSRGGVHAIPEPELKLYRSLRGRLGFSPLPVETPYLTTRQFLPSARVIVDLADLGVASNSLIAQVDEQHWSVTNPFESNIIVREGMILRVSLTRGGDAEYSMECKIQDIRGDQLILGHTRTLNRRQLRNWVRVDVNLPASAVPLTVENGTVKNSGIQIKGRIMDLSGGGLAIRLPVQLQVGSRMLVDFALNDQNLTGVDVEIIRVAPLQNGDEKAYQHSVSFKEIQKSVQERIVRFVFEKQRQDAQWR